MTKQTIVVRKDLNMRKGKMCAQSSHASLKVFADRMEVQSQNDDGTYTYQLTVTPEMHEWLQGQFTKVVLGCQSRKEIVDLRKAAEELNIPCAMITDSGKTEFHGIPTVTCVSLGPGKAEDIEALTKQFSLM